MQHLQNKNTSELFELVRKADVSGIKDLNTILSGFELSKTDVTSLLNKLKLNPGKVLLIDARSEKEFLESAIPCAVNFPVLNTSERHNVGLIYKNYSQTSALWLAMNYANPKAESLVNFLANNNAAEKEIIVYCWRGGGRSRYLSKMISDAGFKPTAVTGGFKAYRQNVNDFFSQKMFPGNLLELSGLTGCGKSELLNSVSDELPVIDLEFSAKHFSSLLGHIPYEIKNFNPVSNQSAFENDVYSQIILNSKKSPDFKTKHVTYLIESESRRIGRMEMPELIYNTLQNSPSVKIVCSLENRISRIVRDYFNQDLRGIEPMIKIMTDKEKFFRQQLSSKVFDELILLLRKGKVNEFTEIMIVSYYDKKYRDKGKTPIAVISTDDIKEAGKNIKEIYENHIKSLNPRV